jgi:hypothetical protein
MTHIRRMMRVYDRHRKNRLTNRHFHAASPPIPRVAAICGRVARGEPALIFAEELLTPTTVTAAGM